MMERSLQLRVVQIHSASEIAFYDLLDDFMISSAHVGLRRLRQSSGCEEFGVSIFSAIVEVDRSLQFINCGSVGDLKKHHAEAKEKWITSQVVGWEC